VPLDPKVLHAPSRQPDRVILTWAGDPATTQAVTWRTSTEVRVALAQIAEAEDGPLFKSKAVEYLAASERFRSNLGEASYHSIQFENLKPDTKYVYRVGDGYNWNEWAHFRTAARGEAPVEFVYVGDAQNNILEMWSRVIRSSFADAPRARFIIHAGDLINTAARDEQWGEWHRAAGWINQSVVSLPVPGNHEYGRNEAGVRELNRHWRPQFTLPENGLPELAETSYYVDLHGVRVVGLNSNLLQAEQAAWLDRVLTGNPNRWTVVTFPQPAGATTRSCGSCGSRSSTSTASTWC
jgi:phosphodiesterase/alkaline phosphatase D-like protein